MKYKRYLFETIIKNKMSLLLLGPRQTGKTTLIQELKPDLHVNLADEETFLEHLSSPGLIKSLIKSNRKIFIDEVQRIPSILNTVQALVDSNKNLQFFLTGSSARKLKRGNANLLPGRIVTYELGPLNLLELEKSFELEKALTVGLLPGIYSQPDTNTARKILRSYAATYLKEEIQAEALTRNLEGFSRFFSVVTSLSGNTIDFTKVAKEAAIERMSARRYYDILIDTLIATEVPTFTRSQKRRLIQHPKFYFFDTGILNGCLNNFVPSMDRRGMLLEHLTLQLMISAFQAKDESVRISTYRTEAHVEVDFILEKGQDVFAIEVKSTNKFHPSDLRGLISFREFFGKKHHPILVYQGELELEVEGIQVFPLTSALKYLGCA